jgi:hypothetical protein
MEDEYILPVTYKGKDLAFPLRIIPQGYTYKFLVVLDEATVIFERDDQGELRALLQDPELNEGKLPETGLLAALSEVLEVISR